VGTESESVFVVLGGPIGRAELKTGGVTTAEVRGCKPGTEVTGQIVVVTLITVVDVNTSVALAGQLVTVPAHLVTV
jgi:hypothetical protein